MASNPLLEEFPRKIWAEHPNMPGLAAFWMQRHDGFRALGAHMDALAADFLVSGLSGDDFLNRVIRPLNDYLSNLHGHHNLEDQHYFPAFKRAEPGLEKDFALLDKDHVTVHETTLKIVEGWNVLQNEGARPAFDRAKAAVEMAETLQEFIKTVDRHLEDEEDIVIPLMLKHGQYGF